MLAHRTLIAGFDCLILSSCIIGFLFHVFGTHLLVKIYSRRSKTAQKLYLINFSIVEALKILLDILLIAIAVSYSGNPPSVAIVVQHKLAIISETMMTLLYYTSVIYLTADRLLAITLELEYHVEKWLSVSKYLVVGTWLLAIVLGVGFSLAHGINRFYYAPYHLYVYFASDIFFIIFAIITYSTIFKRFKNSISLNTIVRRNKTPKETNTISRPSISDAFKNSNFHLVILLMSSFLCCMVVPDFVNVAMVIKHLDSSEYTASYRREHKILTHILVFLNACADIGDACIYIFLQKEVRKILRKKMNRAKNFFLPLKSTEESDNAVLRNALENMRELRETSL